MCSRWGEPRCEPRYEPRCEPRCEPRYEPRRCEPVQCVEKKGAVTVTKKLVMKSAYAKKQTPVKLQDDKKTYVLDPTSVDTIDMSMSFAYSITITNNSSGLITLTSLIDQLLTVSGSSLDSFIIFAEPTFSGGSNIKINPTFYTDGTIITIPSLPAQQPTIAPYNSVVFTVKGAALAEKLQLTNNAVLRYSQTTGSTTTKHYVVTSDDVTFTLENIPPAQP